MSVPHLAQDPIGGFLFALAAPGAIDWSLGPAAPSGGAICAWLWQHAAEPPQPRRAPAWRPRFVAGDAHRWLAEHTADLEDASGCAEVRAHGILLGWAWRGGYVLRWGPSGLRFDSVA